MVIVLQTLSGRSAYQLPVVTIQGIAPSDVLHRGHRGKVKELFAGCVVEVLALVQGQQNHQKFSKTQYWEILRDSLPLHQQHVLQVDTSGYFFARSMTYANQQPIAREARTRHSAGLPWRCSWTALKSDLSNLSLILEMPCSFGSFRWLFKATVLSSLFEQHLNHRSWDASQWASNDDCWQK